MRANVLPLFNFTLSAGEMALIDGIHTSPDQGEAHLHGHRPDLVFSKVDSSDKTSRDVDTLLAGQAKTFKSMADYSDIHKRTSAGLSLLDRKDTAEHVQKSFLEQASSGVMGRFLDPKVIARLKKDMDGGDAVDMNEFLSGAHDSP